MGSKRTARLLFNLRYIGILRDYRRNGIKGRARRSVGGKAFDSRGRIRKEPSFQRFVSHGPDIGFSHTQAFLLFRG